MRCVPYYFFPETEEKISSSAEHIPLHERKIFIEQIPLSSRYERPSVRMFISSAYASCMSVVSYRSGHHLNLRCIHAPENGVDAGKTYAINPADEILIMIQRSEAGSAALTTFSVVDRVAFISCYPVVIERGMITGLDEHIRRRFRSALAAWAAWYQPHIVSPTRKGEELGRERAKAILENVRVNFSVA